MYDEYGAPYRGYGYVPLRLGGEGGGLGGGGGGGGVERRYENKDFSDYEL